MKFNKFTTRKKVFVSIIILISISLIFYLFFLPTDSLYDYENKNTISNENQCTLIEESNIIDERVEIPYSESWNIDEGHSVELDISSVPEGHKIKIKKNNELIDKVYEEKNIEYSAEIDDKFVVEQYVIESGLSEKRIETVISD